MSANLVEAFNVFEAQYAPVGNPAELDAYVRMMAANVLVNQGFLNPAFLLVATEPTTCLLIAEPVDGHYDRREGIGPSVTAMARKHRARALYLISEVWVTPEIREGMPMASEPRFDPRRDEALLVTVDDPARALAQHWHAPIVRVKGKVTGVGRFRQQAGLDWDGFERLLPPELYARNAPGAQA